MTIYEIKEATKKVNPFFFSKDTLRFFVFGQTMKSFKVYKQEDGRFLIQAKTKDLNGNKHEDTIRFFNPLTKELDRE